MLSLQRVSMNSPHSGPKMVLKSLESSSMGSVVSLSRKKVLSNSAVSGFPGGQEEQPPPSRSRRARIRQGGPFRTLHIAVFILCWSSPLRPGRREMRRQQRL